jgi:hypothetical protein
VRRVDPVLTPEDFRFSSKAAVCLLPQPGGFEGVGMALVCAPPHRKTIAVSGEPADCRIQRDAAPEPGAKVAECENGVAEVSDLLNARLKLLEGGVHVRPPLPETLVTVVGLIALDLGRNGYHSASGCDVSSSGPMSPRL